jgi:hypothetical protein
MVSDDAPRKEPSSLLQGRYFILYSETFGGIKKIWTCVGITARIGGINSLDHRTYGPMGGSVAGGCTR